MVGAGAALASRVRECHDAGGRWDPCSPHLTVTSCWSDQQTAFAYVKNTHRSRVSYSPRQHLRLPGARSQGWVSSEARECSGARGDPDTCAGAGASRTGWCWALRAPSLVRGGSRVGVRDTPVPGQSRHSRVPSTHVAPAAAERPRLPLHMAGPPSGSRHRSFTSRLLRKHLESVRGERAWSQAGGTGLLTTLGQGSCSHCLAVLQHLTPQSRPPPSASSKPSCCISTSSARGLSGGAEALARRGCPGRGGEGQQGCSAEGSSSGRCWSRAQERGERGELSLLPAPRREHGARARARPAESVQQ